MAAVLTFAADPGAQAPAAPSIAITLSPAHAAFRSRVEAAANESLASYVQWLGPPPVSRILITDDRSASGAAIVSLPWQSAPETMDVESATAQSIARLWWRAGDQPADRALVSGVCWYLQSRVVETLYDHAFLNPGHSADGVRFFGGAVAWSFPQLRMSRWTAGVSRSAWLGSTSWPQPARDLPADVDAPAVRVALVLASLERMVGWPALQASLAEASRSGATSATARIDVMSAALGHDLSSLSNALEGNAAVDYSLAAVATGTCARPSCQTVRITVARWGDPLAGPDRLAIEAEFADGQRIETAVDGKAASPVVEFESASPIAAVRLDPKRTIADEVNRVNNEWLAAPATNVPIVKWVARWVVWLQHAALTYSALV